MTPAAPITGQHPFARGLLRLALAGWVIVLALTATHKIFLSSDSINNYVHVRYISEHLFNDGSIPLRFQWMENGKALTYPYAFAPWTIAALLFKIMGDYAVTLVMLLGFGLLVWFTWRKWFRGEPYLFALFLVHPVLIEELIGFTMSFVWGTLFGYLFIDAVDKDRKWWALLWLCLAVSTHLLVVGVLLAMYIAVVWWRNRDRRRLLAFAVGLSLPVVIAVAWYTVKTPAVSASGPLFLLLTSLATIALRSAIFCAPMLLRWARRLFEHPRLGYAVAVPTLLGAATLGLLNMGDLVTYASDPYAGYFASASFVPGATYRLLERTDREQGHYFFVQHKAYLSQELFSESQTRIDFAPQEYRCFLSVKGVDYVVHSDEFDEQFKTNEHRRLDELVGLGLASVAYRDAANGFEVYDVRMAREPDPPSSIRDCF